MDKPEETKPSDGDQNVRDENVGIEIVAESRENNVIDTQPSPDKKNIKERPLSFISQSKVDPFQSYDFKNYRSYNKNFRHPEFKKDYLNSLNVPVDDKTSASASATDIEDYRRKNLNQFQRAT